MKKPIIVLLLCLGFAVPAHAVGPLAFMLINYLKQSVKDAVVGHVKNQIIGSIAKMAASSGAEKLMAAHSGPITKEQMALIKSSPGYSEEIFNQLSAAGIFETSKDLISDAEWDEFENLTRRMQSSGEDVGLDMEKMRATVKSMPQMSIGIRLALTQLREMEKDKTDALQAYAAMNSSERSEVIASLSSEYRQWGEQDQSAYKKMLKGGATGLPDDLKKELLEKLQ
jgi:hypothetical protein